MKTPLFVTAALVAVIVLPDGQPSASWMWETINGLGLACIAILVATAVDARTPATRNSLRLHQGFALVAASLAALHALGFLILDPLLFEHLKPTAPLHMWMAVLSLILLLVVTGVSFAPWRQRVFGDFRAFRFWHVALTLLVLLSALVHVAETDAAFRSSLRVWLLAVLMTGLPTAAILMRRRNWNPTHASAPSDINVADVTSRRVGLILLVFALGYPVLRQW